MKKISFFIILLVASLFFTSCEETKSAQFDPVNGQTFYAFASSGASINIKDSTGEGTVDVSINSATINSSERTVTVSVDDDASNAPATTYSFNPKVTIPANEHIGTFTIRGIKTSDLELGKAKQLVLKIASTSVEGIISSESITVDLTLFCDQPTPLDDTLFVGDYLIEQTSPFIDGPTLSDGTIVTLTKVDANTRVFKTETYPNFCGGIFQDFQLNFICEQIIVPTQNSICACGSGDDWYSPATLPTSYDITNDTVFSVTFTDDTQSHCPTGTTQTTYKFTKQ